MHGIEADIRTPLPNLQPDHVPVIQEYAIHQDKNDSNASKALEKQKLALEIQYF